MGNYHDLSNKPLSSSTPIPPSYTEAYGENTPQPVTSKDSLQPYAHARGSDTAAPSRGSAPRLEPPQPSAAGSMAAFFRAMSDAVRLFKNQLGASEKMDRETSNRRGMLAAAQAKEFSDLYNERSSIIERLRREILENVDDLEKKLEAMKELARLQQEAIDRINNGNGTERSERDKLAEAHARLMRGEISPEEYGQAVAEWNNYWEGRSADIEAYNRVTAEYNQQAAAYNKSVQEFIDRYQLSEYLGREGITIPTLPILPPRELPRDIQNTNPPFTPLPPRNIPLLGGIQFPSFDPKTLVDEIHRLEYDRLIIPIDNRLTQMALNATLTKWVEELDDSSSDLLNSKSLMRRLFPAALFNPPPKPVSSDPSALGLNSVGISGAQTEALLGKALVKQMLVEILGKKMDHLKTEEKEAKIDKTADRLLFTSLSVLSDSSVRALFPSLGILADALPNLPQNSPTVPILFSLSLVNRVLENIDIKVLNKAIEVSLEAIPELSVLPPEDKDKIVNALNIGQLLVSIKLLEVNLGTADLTEKLLTALFFVAEPAKLIVQTKEESTERVDGMQKEMETNFVEQGYSQEAAKFLAKVGVDIYEAGVLSPQVTLSPTPSTVSVELLEKSIAAELVLSRVPVENASSIAKTAVTATFKEAQVPSEKEFRLSLGEHLRDLGVKNGGEIAAGALLIPPKLPESPESIVPSAKEGMPVTGPSDGWKRGLQKQIVSIFTGAVGQKVAQQISGEIFKALFGTTNPDAKDVAGVKLPLSVIQVFREQIRELKEKDNEAWTESRGETFKESIKTLESFYSLAIKIMNPAYSFMRASAIIYGNKDMPKTIDMPI